MNLREDGVIGEGNAKILADLVLSLFLFDIPPPGVAGKLDFS
jgi:hypothetical protein